VEATNLQTQVWIENARRETLATEARAQVSKVAVSAHAVQFVVEADQETFAVIAQSWHPAWKATVNGSPETVRKANVAFQAVRVGAGRSEVRLTYEDRAFRTGSILSLGTLAVLAIASVPKRKRL
jgi:uncharacterized membrane protein YfhO